MPSLYAASSNVTTANWNLSTSNTWQGWNYYADSSTSTTWTGWQSTPTWITWNSTNITAITTAVAVNEETVEAREARQRAAEERYRIHQEAWEKEDKERRARLEAAQKQAELTLLENLSPAQEAEYKQSRKFTVHSKDGAKRYILRHGWSGNVDEVDAKGKVLRHMCIHPRETVPVEDSLLTQKLMLDTNEAEFLRIANKSVA